MLFFFYFLTLHLEASALFIVCLFYVVTNVFVCMVSAPAQCSLFFNCLTCCGIVERVGNLSNGGDPKNIRPLIVFSHIICRLAATRGNRRYKNESKQHRAYCCSVVVVATTGSLSLPCAPAGSCTLIHVDSVGMLGLRNRLSGSHQAETDGRGGIVSVAPRTRPGGGHTLAIQHESIRHHLHFAKKNKKK